MRTWLPLLLLLGVALALPASARREPSLGGTLVLAVPGELKDATVDAHQRSPLVEPAVGRTAQERLAHPSVKGLPGWKSLILEEAIPSEDYREWTLRFEGPGPPVARTLQQCFDVAAEGAWPGRVLVAAGVTSSVRAAPGEVVIAFSRSVGPLGELLAGCLLPTTTGPYAVLGDRHLGARDGHVKGPPAIARVELRSFGEPGDLVAGSPMASGVGELLAPFPDVVVLHQGLDVRVRDPLELGTRGDRGLRAFREELAADYLAAIFWAGRGSSAFGILPPGLAPARPLPDPLGGGRPLPLTLNALSSGAERIQVHHPDDDILVDGVVERLAVLLRTRGFAIESRPGGEGQGASDALAVVRWRPPTADPALALLELASRFPDLQVRPPTDSPVADPRLLSADPEERVEAAIALERHWIETRAVVPLVTAERWFAFNPRLRGVRVRPDGVPLIDEAYWGESP